LFPKFPTENYPFCERFLKKASSAAKSAILTTTLAFVIFIQAYKLAQEQVFHQWQTDERQKMADEIR
jgi:hypothetical protein